MKILSDMEEEVKFYQEKMHELIEEYAARDENNNIIFVNNGADVRLKDEFLSEFEEKHKELIELKVDIKDFSFTLEELGELKLSPKELYVLKDYIIEEDAEVKEEEIDIGSIFG